MPTNSKNTQPNSVGLALLIGASVIAISIIISVIIFRVTEQKDTVTAPKKVYENITYVKVHNSPLLGNPDAPITIVEYTDFDCPICKSVFDQILPNLQTDYISTGKAKFVYKNFPLTDIHKNAAVKAEAALCARDQGGDTAFFAYHNELYLRYGSIRWVNLNEELLDIAKVQSLHTKQFTDCVTSEKFKDVVFADTIEAELIGSKGTPTWLIGKTHKDGLTDTVKMSGMPTYKVFQTVIEKLLNEE